MILILSNDNDYTTSIVIKWLLHSKQNFRRIDGQGEMALSAINIEEEESSSLIIKDEKTSISAIKSYWFRRGRIKLEVDQASPLSDNNEMDQFLKKVQLDELHILEEYFYCLLDNKKSIGSFRQKGINKIDALNNARQCGLKVPETLVTGSKAALVSFFDKHQQIIIKPIFEISVFTSEEYKVLSYTSVLDRKVLAQLGDQFFPSLVQKCIEKKYELRVFYLDGICYANAIFSQLSEQTSIDSRRAMTTQMNRRVPYVLPDSVAEKIKIFMKKIDLNCGSVDLIVNKESEYIFLEVNPVGQLGMTSHVGNFKLEKRIAKYLSDA